MVSEFSSFAITGYIDTKAPPEVAGSITGMLYWYEGLAEWVSLTDTPPAVPRGTPFHLAAWWLNQSAEPISGHVGLTITKPDGTKVSPTDVLNQNNWVAPGDPCTVQFEPVILDQSGEYQAKVTLSTIGQVLDEKTYVIASVTALVEVTSITINPTSLTDRQYEYQTHLGIGYWGAPFTISITFSNPHDYDVWLAPDFAFGYLTGEPLEFVEETVRWRKELVLHGFEPAPVLYYRLLIDTEYMQGDYSSKGATWQKLWHPQNKGSNMTQYVYDPDGNPLVAGGECWLKVPAKGTATTVKQGHVGIKAHELLPAVFDICVQTEKGGFYLVYDPGWTIDVFGKIRNYRRVEYDLIVGAMPNVVSITPT